MKHFIYIIVLIFSAQLLYANVELPIGVEPPSYTAPNGKTYTWGQNFAKLSEDYSLSELVNMPVWICCGNTEFESLPRSCRKGILNSNIKPHEVQKISANRSYKNSNGDTFTPDPDRLRLYGFCMVESDSRGIMQTVDINAVCDELRDQMVKEGQEPCSDLTPQNVYPDYDRQLIYYTVCGKTYSKPLTDEFRRTTPVATQTQIVKEVVNCVDDFVNLPVVKMCEGETYEWNIDGQSYSYTEAGTYLHSNAKADDCGKVNTILNLDFYEPIDTTIVPEMRYDFAAGETYAFQNITLSEAGTYTESYTDSNGCNAIATIVLQEKEVPQQVCPDCISNAKDLGNVEVGLRLNYGKQPVSPSVNPINHLGWSGAIEAGYWKEHTNKVDLLNGPTCRNSLFEYGILGGIASQKLYGGESSECDCNDASEGSAIHAYIEPAVRWHFLGMCERSKLLPIPVAGVGLRLHYNDHKLEDISKLSLSPKVFAEGRWYLSDLLRTRSVMTVADGTSDQGIDTAFISIGGEAFAPGFTFSDLNYIGYLKFGFRF